jgi:hypothetical protein
MSQVVQDWSVTHASEEFKVSGLATFIIVLKPFDEDSDPAEVAAAIETSVDKAGNCTASICGVKTIKRSVRQ